MPGSRLRGAPPGGLGVSSESVREQFRAVRTAAGPRGCPRRTILDTQAEPAQRRCRGPDPLYPSLIRVAEPETAGPRTAHAHGPRHRTGPNAPRARAAVIRDGGGGGESGRRRSAGLRPLSSSEPLRGTTHGPGHGTQGVPPCRPVRRSAPRGCTDPSLTAANRWRGGPGAVAEAVDGVVVVLPAPPLHTARTRGLFSRIDRHC